MKNYEINKKTFLKKMAGNSLKYKRYLGAPIKYAGGKSLAVGTIIEYLPTNINKVISPFIGGGSVEIAIATEIGIPVIGYDIFDILVNFWNEFINNKDKLISNLKDLTPDKEFYAKIRGELKLVWKKKKTLPKDELAWKYFFNHNLSYGPGFLGWMSSNYLDKNKYDNMIKKLSLKKNHNIEVYCDSFENVIPKHNQDFMYLDPPILFRWGNFI
ncbi:DNA adenine methylase [Mycoplasma zalophidermidis]|uniref:DNA adenine methylase n=1 Tax=Mycoplasma zalophidermidis TaxID=398174 RepID=UPI00215BFC30|nr:DNA adenine methylase [Mycoplasma zalophidermidis]MCR8966446.1 DNA adenine methylase [Mycoplasma zalophidermidis]